MSKKPPTLREFQKRFPTEESCLDNLMRIRYGERFTCFKCLKEARYYRVTTRRCFVCEHCGYQVYPTAGTPFEKTRTSVRDWFFVMFLFCASRNGVAAKEVQRQIGVTYKTAWRMCKEIREYMGEVDGDKPLGGDKIVEVDETWIGGRIKRGEPDNKQIVFGMIERGGEVITRLVTDRSTVSLFPHVAKWVREGSRVMTDEWQGLRRVLADFYHHEFVNHRAEEYVRGEVHTNTIEAFWSHFKRSVAGTHISVS
jgi:transposase-like protein